MLLNKENGKQMYLVLTPCAHDGIGYTAPSNAVFSSEQKTAEYNPIMRSQKGNTQQLSLTQSDKIW
uniref:Uncharacterized protein n=1 Tax=Romanomermis culicivorax TaxID=13658 RepID=A0A915KZD2_ROMCU